jgi:hypothetical protein
VIRLTVNAFTVSAACPDASRSLLLSVGESAYGTRARHALGHNSVPVQIPLSG